MGAYAEVETFAILRKRVNFVRQMLSLFERQIDAVGALETEAANEAGLSWPIDESAGLFMEDLDDMADRIVGSIQFVHFRYKYVIQPGRPAAFTKVSSALPVADLQITADGGAPFAQMIDGGADAGDKVSIVWTDPVNGGTYDLGSTVFIVNDISTPNVLELVGDWPDHVTNGTFTGSADGWTLGAGWAYGTNKIDATLADASAEQANADMAIPLVENCAYVVEFDWNRTAGTITPKLGTTAGTTLDGASGSASETIVAGGANPKLEFACAGFSGDLDNVVVRPAHMDEVTSLVITLAEEWQA